MNHTAGVLPDLEALNPSELKALIVEQHKQILIHHEQLLSRDAEIEHLQLLLAKLRRMQFGRSSEKVDRQIAQLELRLGELEQSRAIEAEPAKPSAAEHGVARPVRRPLPAHLRREVQTYLPPQKACPDCGGKLKPLGEDVTEILEYVPERVKVIRQVRPKLACAGCDRIVQAPAPSRPLERSIAGPGLLAHVLVSKYSDHLPLYRQAEIYAREGVDIDRSTMSDWVGGASRTLRPLVEALKSYVLSAEKLHGDDVPVPVLEPGNGNGREVQRRRSHSRDERGRLVRCRRLRS